MNKWTATLVGSWIALFLVGHDITGQVDGYLFPVVSNFQIDRVEPVQGGIEIWGSFDKIRDCDFESITGRLTTSTHNTDISIEFRDEETIRTPGDHTFGPWFIKIKPTKTEQLAVYSRHRCNSYWTTITQVR